MLANRVLTGSPRTRIRRHGAAAVEFALCLPLLTTIMLGLWEVGRITEVQLVMWNSAREAARDASLGSDSLSTVATNLLTYLQAAEPTAFGTGHTTSLISPVITLPTNSTGYTCWDNTANRELFTISFRDYTTSTSTDPTTMLKLDRFAIVISVPYTSIAWSPLVQITGTSRLSADAHWTCMIDSPFMIIPTLPAQ